MNNTQQSVPNSTNPTPYLQPIYEEIYEANFAEGQSSSPPPQIRDTKGPNYSQTAEKKVPKSSSRTEFEREMNRFDVKADA